MKKAVLILVALLTTATQSGVVFGQDYVCMESNQGDFCMELYPESAPVTVANFLNYVSDGDYDETMIHRSVSNFIIQGGGFQAGTNTLGLSVPTDPPIVNEFGISNTRGTVAMAKLGGDPNSATSQWFVNIGNNSANLDNQNGGFTVFAEIVSGMGVVDAIGALPVANLQSSLGSAFSAVPEDSEDLSIQLNELVIITRAYATDTLPTAGNSLYQCSDASPADTLTEFCGTSLTFPVQVGSKLYEGTLNLLSATSGFRFQVDSVNLKVITDSNQQRATFNGATGVLSIPSVRYGNSKLVNLELLLINANTLEFSLQSYDIDG